MFSFKETIMTNVWICGIFLFTVLSAQSQGLQPVVYADGDQSLEGLVTGNTGKKRPGVLILPAWKGIDQEAKSAALALEEQGYIAFIADIYGKGNTPSDNSEAAKISGYYKKDYEAYQGRIAVALTELKRLGALPDKIAVIGYCFGGTGALEAARGKLPVQGVVSIHGGLGKAADRPTDAITAKVLIEHPAEDKSVSAEALKSQLKELDEGGADWQLITYARCGHTFTNPDSPEYNEVMARRAWKHTLLFLEEVLH